jgi:hypothetical protein
MIVVHTYEVWDITRDNWVRMPIKGTEERIKESKGRIVPGSAEEVAPSDVDEYGLYRPTSR